MTDLQKQIQRLSKGVCENRSDISDILERILNGEDWDESDIESRFAKVTIKTPKGDIVTVMYDTLTTLMEVTCNDMDEWVIAGESPKDDLEVSDMVYERG